MTGVATAAVVALFAVIAGFALGQRFRVFILVPATVIMLTIVAAIGVVQSQSFGGTVGLMALAAGLLQIGFLAGSAAATLLWHKRPEIDEKPTEPSSSAEQPVARRSERV